MIDVEKKKRELLQRRLVQLGDMMGDGLHYENPSISREYRKVMNLLYPEITKQRREKTKAKNNQSVMNFLKNKKCDCGGEMFQTRDGGLVIKCSLCHQKYQLKWKKRTK